jgi:hypothetical protein
MALDWQMRLIMIVVCGKSQSHRLGGEIVGYTGQDAEEVGLKLRMATSAALRW